VKLAKDVSIWDDKPLLAAVTGAIWKCAISPENVRRLDELNTVNTLVSLLSDENDEVRFSIRRPSFVLSCYSYLWLLIVLELTYMCWTYVIVNLLNKLPKYAPI
jgi:hypothetical protein